MQDNVRNLTNTRESQAETAAASRNVYQLFKHKKDCTWNTPLATGQGTWGCNCGLDNLLLELEDFELTDLSASPQPRCPKCQSEDLQHLTHIPTVAQHVKCKSCLAAFDTTHLHSFAQFFAAAPAQEPDSDLLARYNRAYSILGEALNLNAEFYGLVEMAQVAANRLTGKYDSAAQEQPVENSTTCEKCDRKLTRKPADRHNWYDLTGSTRCEATDYKLRHSPQKGKP